MNGTMVEDVKEIEIEIVTEIEKGTGTRIGIGIGIGRETDIGLEMTGTMVVKGREKGTGKDESGKEETGNEEGEGAVQGAGAGTAETGIMKMEIIARGELVAVLAHGGGQRMMAAPEMSPRRKRKRKRRRATVLITQILKSLRPIGYELPLG